MSYQLTIEAASRVAIQFNADGTCRLHGVHAVNPRVIARSGLAVVVKTDGYAMNPGSRYSGLHAYYPGEEVTYILGEKTDAAKSDGRECYWCYPIVEKSTARKKAAS